MFGIYVGCCFYRDSNVGGVSMFGWVIVAAGSDSRLIRWQNDILFSYVDCQEIYTR